MQSDIILLHTRSGLTRDSNLCIITYVVGDTFFACSASTRFSHQKVFMQIVHRKVFYADLAHELYL